MSESRPIRPVLTGAVAAAAALLIAACGGGGDAGSGEGVPAPVVLVPPVAPPAISTDDDFGTFVNFRLTQWFSDAFIQRMNAYDGDFSDSAEASTCISPTSGAHPFDATRALNSFVAANQGYANAWPVSNARMTLAPTGIPRVSDFSSLDLTNGQAGEGQARLYYGVQRSGTSSPHGIPMVFLIESIITRNGVPQYRAVQVFEGHLAMPCSPGPAGQLVVRGTYSIFAVEAFNGGSTGLLADYKACWVAEGSGSLDTTCRLQ